MSRDEHNPSEDRLRELLVGRSIVHSYTSDEQGDYYQSGGDTGTLVLDDGTVLKVWGNDGGCACSSGCYPLAELNEVGNIITNVELEEAPAGDYTTDTYEGHYRIFVYAEHRQLLASFEGTDGNGYYGTGWWLRVEEQG